MTDLPPHIVPPTVDILRAPLGSSAGMVITGRHFHDIDETAYQLGSASNVFKMAKFTTDTEAAVLIVPPTAQAPIR